jgi:hypothetical protein
MRQTYGNLVAKLKTKLQSIVNGDGETMLYQVLDYKGAEMTGYPTALVIDAISRGELIDTHRNERIFAFNILLYQEQSSAGKTKEEATIAMRNTVDSIIESFDTDPTLSGEVKYIKVVPTEIDYTVQQGSFIFATFLVECVDIVNNY